MSSNDANDRPNDLCDAERASAAMRDMRPFLQLTLGLDVVLRLTLWGLAFAISVWLFGALEFWPEASFARAGFVHVALWAFVLTWWILLFNVLYVAQLAALRLLIPTPREGRYPKAARGLDRQLIWATLLAALNKARYLPPFPGFLVFQIANTPPMCWLAGPIYGPKSRSCYPLDPFILDPHLVEIGRNVVIGFNATIAGHYQDRDAYILQRTVIEDDVVIGGQAIVYGGVRIRAGAVIGANAIVLPGTVVGENEFWGGVPAKKLRDLPPASGAAHPTEAANLQSKDADA